MGPIHHPLCGAIWIAPTCVTYLPAPECAQPSLSGPSGGLALGQAQCVGRPFSGRPRPDRFPIGRRGSETAGLCQLPPTEAGLGAAFPRVQVGPRRASGRVDPDIGPRRRSTERIARHGSTGTMTDVPGTRVPGGRGVDRVDPENPRRARSLCRRGSWRVHFSGRGADETERGNMGYSCRRIRGGRHETSCFLSGDEDSDEQVRLEGTYRGVRASIARCRALRHSTHDQGCVHEPPRSCAFAVGVHHTGRVRRNGEAFRVSRQNSQGLLQESS